MRKVVLVLVVLMMLLPLSAVVVNAQDRPDLLIWADATRAPVMTALAEQFTADFGFTAEVQEIGMGDIRANIAVAGPAGEGPDIIVAVHDWIGELVLNGSVRPINLGDAAADFTEASISLFTYQGNLYGMPYAVENVAFFRNPELVPDAPATWDEVKSISEELSASGASEYGYMIQTSDAYHFQPMMSAFGGYVFGEGADGAPNAQDVGIDSPGAIAAGDWLASMAAEGLLVPSVDYDVLHTMFETGQAAMIVTGPWALPRLRAAGANYAISDIPAGPAGPGRPFIGGQGFMVSNFIDEDRVLVAETFLIDFMAAAEPMQQLYDADPRPPAFIEVRDALDDPDLAAFASAGAVGIAQPSIPEMASVWGAWANAMSFSITQELTPQQAFSDAATQIRALIESGPSAAPVAEAGDTPPEDGPQFVGIPGTVQSAIGCAADWTPECPESALMYSAASDVWMATFTLPAGDYEYKAALDGAWDENYGVGGERDGANIALSLAEETAVTFVYDHKTNVIADSVNTVLATVPGSFQAALGCAGDWAPECLRSWLQDADGDGIYTFTTTAIPAGDYEGKVAVGLTWDENYGVDGERDGANLAFSVPADGTSVTFSFDSSTNVLTIIVGS
jgi:maltose/maltodextrin transport system substrate-binding protein/arabinogalactan oligomer/maltooligosaccharide transport system substrate-binding protein